MRRRVSPGAAFLMVMMSLAWVTLGPAAVAHAASKSVPLPRLSPHLHGTTDGSDSPASLTPADSGGGDSGATGSAAGDGSDVDTGGGSDIDSGDTGTDVDTGTDAGFAGPESIDEPEPITDLGAANAGTPIDLTPGGGGPTDIRPASSGNYVLMAKLAEDASAIPDGLTWRIFGDKPGTDGKLPLIKEIKGGTVDLSLDPGTYLVNAAYGHAGTTKRITVTGQRAGGAFILDAGGLRLSAVVGKDQPLAGGDLHFDIYAPDDNGTDERALLFPNAPAKRIIRLSAGIYHVVCRYGDANAIVRADIRVEPNKLTDATIFQKAARITLKLVLEHGGEALADTAWSVVTPAGESVTDSVGAFPSVVLGAGEYSAVAKHDGKTYERKFTVEAGLDRDVEVLAK